MNDLLEVNYNNRKQITGTDLLFNKHKISSEVASLSSSPLSSLSSNSSSRSSRNKSNIKPKKSQFEKNIDDDFMNFKKKKPIIMNNQNDNDDDDDSEANEDDDDDAEDDEDNEDNEDDEDDEDNDDEDDENKSLASNDSESRVIKKKKDIIKEKREILYQLSRLEAKGYSIPNNYNMQSDLYEMKQEYERIIRDKDIDASIRFQRKMLMALNMRDL